MKVKVYGLYDNTTDHFQGTAEQLLEQLKARFDWLDDSPSLMDAISRLNRSQAFAAGVEQ